MPTTDYNRGYNKGRTTGERKADEALAREKERAAGTPWGTWASADSAVRDVSIQTTPRFGCVVFMASNVCYSAETRE